MGCGCRGGNQYVHIECAVQWAKHLFLTDCIEWHLCKVCGHELRGPLLEAVLAELRPLAPKDATTLSALTYYTVFSQFLSEAGRFSEAGVIQRRLIRATEACELGFENRLTALNNYAVTLHTQGSAASKQKARQLMQDIKAALAETPGMINSEAYAALLHNMATQEASDGNYAGALELETRLVALLRDNGTLMQRGGLSSWQNMAHTLLCLGKSSEALEIYRTTCAAQARELGTEHDDTRFGVSRLVRCLCAVGKSDEAIQRLQQLLSPPPRGYHRSVKERRQQLVMLAGLLVEADRRSDAVITLQELLTLETAELGAGSRRAKATAAMLDKVVSGS